MKPNTVKVKAGEYWSYLKNKGYPEDFLISKYTNVWGEEVLLAYNTSGIIINNNPLKKCIAGVEDIMEGAGFYINNENGDKVFLDIDFKEYSRLKKKYSIRDALKERVNFEFIETDFYLQIGPNESVIINDTHIVPDCFWVIPQNEEDEKAIAKVIVDTVKNYLNDNYEQFYITILDLEKFVVEAICNLDISYLSGLEEQLLYSYNFKEELIFEFAKKFKYFHLKGINNLKVKPSKCLHCYPNLNAFSFHHPDTDEFIIRYVIGKDSKGGFQNYIVEECRNNPHATNDFFKGYENKK